MLKENDISFPKHTTSEEEKALNAFLKEAKLVELAKKIFSEEEPQRGTHQAYDIFFRSDEEVRFFVSIEKLGIGVRQDSVFIIRNEVLASFWERVECQKSVISKRVLEKISHHLAELVTGLQIVDFLKAWGVPGSLIEYPNTKWRMVFTVLCYYANSPEMEDRKKLCYLIEKIYHPLIVDGDFNLAKEHVDKINDLLFYDNFSLLYNGDKKQFCLEYEPTESEMEEMHEIDMEEEAKIEATFFQNPKAKEYISLLKKAYQSCINIVEAFCENPNSVDEGINNAYVLTQRVVNHTKEKLRSLEKNPIDVQATLANLYFPFINLFSAETQFNHKGKKINWDDIRPKMYSSYGDIEDIFGAANGSDTLSEPKIQESLNEISILLSERKEKNEPKEKNEKNSFNAQVINIVKDSQFFDSPLAIGHRVEQEVEISKASEELKKGLIEILKTEKGLVDAQDTLEISELVKDLEKNGDSKEIKTKFDRIFSFAKNGVKEVAWGLVASFLSGQLDL